MTARDAYVETIRRTTRLSQTFLDIEEMAAAEAAEEPLRHGAIEDRGDEPSGCVLSIAEVHDLCGGREDEVARHVRDLHFALASDWFRRHLQL